MAFLAETFSRLAAVGALVGAALLGGTAAQAQDVSFEGKTIEIMVNFAAGGGTDTAARLVAPFVARHLPGNPKFIVTNKGGAGGTAAIDYLINSVAPNGLTIGYFSGTPIRWALGMEQVPDGTGDLPFVVGRSVNQIVLTRKDLDLTFDTFPGYAKPIFLATNSPDNHFAIRIKLLANVIGADQFKIVSGYDTQGKMLGAVRAGEAEMAQANDSYFGANRDALEGDGVLVPLGQMGEFRGGKIVAQKGLEDVPVFDELWRATAPDTLDTPEYRTWEALHMAMAVQNSFVLPPNTPAEYLPVWEAAILAAFSDPDYVKQLADVGIPEPASMGAAEFATTMKRMRESFADPAVRAVIEAVIASNME